MTIRVEREALLTVINTSQSSQSKASTTRTLLSSKPCNPCIREEDEFVIVDSVPTRKFYSDLIPSITEDDETSSICTLSTSSVSDCDDASRDFSSVQRRVTFAPQVVSHTWTRERTPIEEVSNLFYSAMETQTFRQEYRLEKKLLSELSIDAETFDVNEEDLSNLMAASSSTNNTSRHRISRVCVVYNDKLETFCNPADLHQNNTDSAQQLTASFGSQKPDCNKSISSDFFDNDSFWSGSLTWY